MVTLTDALVELVEAGQVEVTEAYAKAVDKSLILQALKTKGHDVSFAEKGDSRNGDSRNGDSRGKA
jgi:hypothetical protein